MRALVTGGCGFIGSHLVRRLVREDIDVSVLDDFRVGRPGDLGDIASECCIIQGSVTNWDRVQHGMSGAHIVYHLAGRMDWSERRRHPAAVFQTNTMGTIWVLTMARAMGVQKVIFTSSAAVYGDLVPGVVGAPCSPVSIYGASKLAAEAACRGFNALGLEVVVLRLFNVWGPGGRGVVNKFLDGSEVIEGDGDQTRDFVHVSDVVNALIAAQHWDPGIYNIGTETETTILGLWRLIHGDREPVFVPPRLGDIYRSCAELGRVKRVWKPRKDITNVAR